MQSANMHVNVFCFRELTNTSSLVICNEKVGKPIKLSRADADFFCRLIYDACEEDNARGKRVECAVFNYSADEVPFFPVLNLFI
jgi:hypothetical protein